MTLDEIYDYIGEQHGRTKPNAEFSLLKGLDARASITKSEESKQWYLERRQDLTVEIQDRVSMQQVQP